MMDALLGRRPLRYHFTVVPRAVEGVPDGVGAVSVVWERGSKVAFTEPAAVDARTHSAAFREAMRQVCVCVRSLFALPL